MLKLFIAAVHFGVISVALTPTAEAGPVAQGFKFLRKFASEGVEHLSRRVVKPVGTNAAREGAEVVGRKAAEAAAKQLPTVASKSVGLVDDAARLGSKVVKGAGSAADDILVSAWKHKGTVAAIAAGGSLALHGGEIVDAAGEHFVEPMVSNVIAPVARITTGAIVIAGLLVLVALLCGGLAAERIKQLYRRWRRRLCVNRQALSAPRSCLD